MPFVWEVQPYETLSELREMYTAYVVQVSRKKAAEMAPQIETWMKQNAPWQDRTIEERLKAYGRRKHRTKRQRLALLQARAAGREVKRVVATPAELTTAPYYVKRGARAGLFAKPGDAGESVREQQERIRKSDEFLKLKQVDKLRLGKINEKRIKAGKMPRGNLPKGTSAAQSYLRDKVVRTELPQLVSILLGHDRYLSYGVWLELAHGQRWSIVTRTLDHWLPKVHRNIKQIINLRQYQGNLTIPTEPTEQEHFEENVRQAELVHDRAYRPFSEEQHEPAKGRAKTRRKSQLTLEWERKYYDVSREQLQDIYYRSSGNLSTERIRRQHNQDRSRSGS